MTVMQTTPVVDLRAAAAGDVESAAQRLYDAETALHAARQSHVDRWISAASDRLHEAYLAYHLAVATPPPGRGTDGARSTC